MLGLAEPFMNAPLLPEVLLQLRDDPQTRLELATEGVLRYVWESRWGPVLVEVREDGAAYVNGDAVQQVGALPTRPQRST